MAKPLLVPLYFLCVSAASGQGASEVLQGFQYHFNVVSSEVAEPYLYDTYDRNTK